jgi:hypothetical protein
MSWAFPSTGTVRDTAHEPSSVSAEASAISGRGSRCVQGETLRVARRPQPADRRIRGVRIDRASRGRSDAVPGSRRWRPVGARGPRISARRGRDSAGTRIERDTTTRARSRRPVVVDIEPHGTHRPFSMTRSAAEARPRSEGPLAGETDASSASAAMRLPTVRVPPLHGALRAIVITTAKRRRRVMSSGRRPHWTIGSSPGETRAGAEDEPSVPSACDGAPARLGAASRISGGVSVRRRGGDGFPGQSATRDGRFGPMPASWSLSDRRHRRRACRGRRDAASRPQYRSLHGPSLGCGSDDPLPEGPPVHCRLRPRDGP